MMLFRRVLTYRLAFYYLAVLMLLALALSAVGIVRQPLVNLAFSTAVALFTCHAVNWAFARVFGARSNWESVSISAFIITLIITPAAPSDLGATIFLVLVSAWAMASKYMVAVRKQHLFNPAAFGAALVGLGLHRTVSWWVGDYWVLLPAIALGGALMLTRLRYYGMVAAFAVVVLGISAAHADLSRWPAIAHSLSMMGIHSMFGFFGLVMLTEPRTAPPGGLRQVVYGAVVGLLFSPFTHVGSYYFTPEVALLCGNLLTFLSNKRRIRRWAEGLRLSNRPAGA